MSNVLLPCPFCGQENTTLSRDPFFAVLCVGCGASGPQALDEERARELWDQRISVDENDWRGEDI